MGSAASSVESVRGRVCRLAWMSGRIGGLVVVAALIFTPSSVAAGGQELIEGDPPLPIGCQDSFTVDLAMLCHPSTRLRGGFLTVTGRVRVDGARFPGGVPQFETAFGQPPVSGRYIESHEPLLSGERLAARWSRLPPRSVLAARVADPLRGSRPVSFELDPATTSASLTVARGGRVTLVNGLNSKVIEVPPLAVGDPRGPAAPWAAGSPQGAVQAVIDHLDLDGPDDLAWLCAAIEPAERPVLGFGVPGAGLFARPAPDVDTAAQPADRCPLLELAVVGLGNVPPVTGSTGAIVAVRSLGAGQAVVTATLTHRFRSSESAPAPPGGAVTVTVPVLVTLTADGFWHVSTLGTLLPRFALHAASESSDTELLAARSAALGDAQRALRKLERVAASLRHRATSGVGHRPTCRGSKRSLIADPANDITVAYSQDRTRNPRLATMDACASRSTSYTRPPRQQPSSWSSSRQDTSQATSICGLDGPQPSRPEAPEAYIHSWGCA